ncbi:MAG: hypothetical protein IT185_09635 [Acidobacteria bacterium]|jgi:hypothetical protein|nr:hypothetical protein [Acidobacteriota bacterium]
MTKSHDVARMLVIGAVVAAGINVSAQQIRNEGLSAEAQVQQRRFQFQLMEGILTNAVRQGAVEVVMRAQTMTIGALFMGEAKAKGFPLDGYGIVFDIEIPIIRESAVIASQMMVPPPPPGPRTVAGRGATPAATTRSAGVVTEDPMARSPIVPDAFLTEPNQFYRNAVRDKLVDAMLDYSQALKIAATESLSVVARSEDDPMPNSLYDDSRTLILRITGADLALFHEGKITREEARKRVVESQF